MVYVCTFSSIIGSTSVIPDACPRPRSGIQMINRNPGSLLFPSFVKRKTLDSCFRRNDSSGVVGYFHANADHDVGSPGFCQRMSIQ